LTRNSIGDRVPGVDNFYPGRRLQRLCLQRAPAVRRRQWITADRYLSLDRSTLDYERRVSGRQLRDDKVM